MKDNEIIKEATEAYEQNLSASVYVGDLLRIIKQRGAENKKYRNKVNNQKQALKTAYDTIRRRDDVLLELHKELEASHKNCNVLTSTNLYLAYRVDKVKAEAIKEFAERLCEDRVSNDPVVIAVKTELKMTEQKE